LIFDILKIKVGDNLVEIGWLNDKKHGMLNIITSAVLGSIWKPRNEICFRKTGWKSMEILLYKIVGLLQNWIILCPPEKKELLKTTLEEIKASPKRVPTVAQLNLGRNQESQCWATWEDQVFGDVKDEEVAVEWAISRGLWWMSLNSSMELL